MTLDCAIHLHACRVRAAKPLILCLTNVVSMDLVANGLLAVGASPLMSCAIEEIEELVALSHAVLINIGTLDKPFLERALAACASASKSHTPVILDPVGSGASKMRTQAALELLDACHVVKGNATEILSLSTSQPMDKSAGVDTCHRVDEVQDAARHLAYEKKCTVVVTGARDFITNGDRDKEVSYGSPLMTQVTGVGCLLGALIAAHYGATRDALESPWAATGILGHAGQEAAQGAPPLGQFRMKLMDALSVYGRTQD